MMPTSKINTARQIMLISIFALFIFSPLVVAVVAPGKTLSTIEKRELVAFPEITPDLNMLKQFPAEFEKYFNDHFGFREWLIRRYNYIHMFWLKTSPIEKVMLGKNGWLYRNEYKITDDYRGLAELNQSQLKFWQNALTARKRWLAKQSIHYVLAIAPNKQSIYPEHLPNYVNQVHTDSRLDQFLSYMRNNSSVDILDLRIPLKEAKKDRQVYFKVDSHWNQIGAYAASAYIIQNIRPWFPHKKGLAPLSFSRATTVNGTGQDLANMLGLNNILNEQVVVPILDTTCARRRNEPATHSRRDVDYKEEYTQRRPLVMGCEKSELRCIAFGDSCLRDVIPFLSEHFAQIVFIRNRYTRNKAQNLIQHIRPHILIEEFVENTVVPVSVDYINLGNIMLSRGEINEAARQYQEALTLAPQNPSAHKNLGIIMLHQKNYKQAISHFTASLAQEPKDKNTQQMLQSALTMEAGIKAKTGKIRNRLLTRTMNTALHKQLGGIYKTAGQLDRALTHFSLALAVDPESELLLQKIAEICIYRKNYKNAAAVLEKLTNLNPERAVYYYNMACIEAIRNNTEQSVTLLKTAIEKGYDDFEKVRTDPDLDRLRGNPGYQQLIKRYAAKPEI